MKSAVFRFILLMITLGQTQTIEKSAWMTLLSANPDQTARHIIEKAESLRGYYLQWTNRELLLNLPADSLSSFMAWCTQNARVREKGFSATDQGLALSQLQATIRSRRKLLDQYFAMAQSSGAEHLSLIEQEMIRLTEQIENAEGERRALEARIRDARVSVYLMSPENPLPAENTNPFHWINSVGLIQHRERF